VEKLKWFGLFILGIALHTTNAATRYWIGGSSTAWNNNANWGTSSGTGSPASYPASGDIAIFDGGGLINCTLTASVSLGTLSITSAYTKTITQGSYALSISGNSSWAGGTFIGGSALFSNGGSFNLNGTNFTSTSGTLAISGTFSFGSGTFTHNNGTITFGTNSFTVSGTPTFNNLKVIPNYNTVTFSSSFSVAGNFTLDATGAWINVNISSGQNITVNGSLYITGDNQASLNTGTVSVNGNVSVTNTSNGAGGSGTIKVTGASNQTLTGSGTFSLGNLPSIVVSKSSGTLTLSGYITVAGPTWNLSSGTIAAGTSTVCFYNTGVPFTISGTQTLNTVIFYGNYSTYTITNALTASDVTLDATYRCDVYVNSSMTVNGALLITGSGYYKLNTGTVNVKGSVTNNNTNTTSGGGTASFIMNGTSNQTLTGTSAINQGAMPPFIINKSSGTLFLSGYITLYQGFTWTAGTVSSGVSTCVFYDAAALGSQTINASATGMSFYNVVFDQPDYEWTQIASDISIAGSMTITAGSGIQTNNHIISLGRNFTCLNTTASGAGYVFNGGTGCSMILNGSSGQTLTTNNPAGSSNKAVIYDLTINNTASRSTFDDIMLADILTVSHSLTMTNGRMLTTSSNYLSLKDGVSCNTGNSSCYINGPLRYEMSLNGSRTLNFPIGENGNWRYVTLNLNHSTGTSYTYIGQVFGTPAMSFSYTLPSTVSHVSYQRYTQIDRIHTSSGATSNTGLSGNQTIIMRYDVNDVVNDYTNLTIAKTTGTGSPWVDIGGNASANTTGTIVSTSTPSAFTSFSKFSLANKSGGLNPLPVEIVDFAVYPCDSHACLSWTTASETRNDYFTIERSNNGLHFETLGKVKGAGNYSGLQKYMMEDGNPYAGISYYRLKQTDFDGTSKYFKTVSFYLSRDIADFDIFPNPVETNKCMVKTKQVPVSLHIYNMLGERIRSIVITEINTEIDLSLFESGVYTIVNELSGLSKKLIINK
jgi:hypothetical protein